MCHADGGRTFRTRGVSDWTFRTIRFGLGHFVRVFFQSRTFSDLPLQWVKKSIHLLVFSRKRYSICMSRKKNIPLCNPFGYKSQDGSNVFSFNSYCLEYSLLDILKVFSSLCSDSNKLLYYRPTMCVAHVFLIDQH